MLDNKELTTDEKVALLFKKVQSKKEEVESAERPCWQTSGVFGFTANSSHDRVDIRTITDSRKLVDILSFLYERRDSTKKAADKLGVTYNFKWLQYTVEEWESDLKTRVNQLTIQDKRKELATAEARLNLIISPELKAKMELDSITKLLED